MSDSGSEAGDDICNDLSDQTIVEKYMKAAEICNFALKQALERAVPGADAGTICKEADTYMQDECQKLYKNGKKVEGKEEREPIKRGVAMPTCVCINEVIGHYAPMPGEGVELHSKIKDGDLVSVDLGCHLDGYIAQAAHTIMVTDDPVNDRRADVIHAGWKCAEAAVRAIKPGVEGAEVTKMFGLSCEDYECKAVVGAQSRQMKQHIIDANRAILMENVFTDALEFHAEEVFTFKENMVFAVDVMVSTGEGKPIYLDNKKECETTILKRDVEEQYALKTTHARHFLAHVNKEYPVLPFNIRGMREDDEHKNCVAVGVSESVRNGLCEAWEPTRDKHGTFVAQFKFTICLFPHGPRKITGLHQLQPNVKSNFAPKSEALVECLKQPAPGSKKKKNNKKKSPEQKGTNPYPSGQ